MTSSHGTLAHNSFVGVWLAEVYHCSRASCVKFISLLSIIIFGVLTQMNIGNAEQSLVFPLHYTDDFVFYHNVFMNPLGRRLVDENYGSPITFDRFHLTGYDDALFFKRHKFMIVNDSSQGGSVALIACVLNGDEAIEFSKRMMRSDVLEDDQMHPYGFATLRVSGKIAMYNDGPSQQPRIVLAIDPCHVGTSFRSRRLDSYSGIRAPIRRWSQYFDGIIPNFDAALPYY